MVHDQAVVVADDFGAVAQVRPRRQQLVLRLQEAVGLFQRLSAHVGCHHVRRLGQQVRDCRRLPSERLRILSNLHLEVLLHGAIYIFDPYVFSFTRTCELINLQSGFIRLYSVLLLLLLVQRLQVLLILLVLG